MRITFVTGASGSGKTALNQRILDHGLDGTNVRVTELDGDNVPAAADTAWLQWRAAEYLNEATELAAAGEWKHLVVTGIVWPFAVIESNQWQRAVDAGVDVRFVVLDRPWPEVAATLSARYADWDNAEDAAEQLDNNRRLQRRLRTQASRLRGAKIVGGDLDVAIDVVLGSDW